MKLTDRLGRRRPDGAQRSRGTSPGTAPGTGHGTRPGTGPVTAPGADVGDGGDLFHTLYLDVVDRIDTTGISHIDPAELSDRVADLVDRAVVKRAFRLSHNERGQLIASISNEILGLGPLEPVLADATVSDILVNGAHKVYVERKGVLKKTNIRFRDDAHLLNIINRIVAPIGRRIDEASPMVDARLPDGSRVNAVIPPLSIDGPVLSIRRFGTGPLSPKELVNNGAMSAGMAHYLKRVVRSRCNTLVCGGTGAGKTTLLNALSSFISSRERIVTIEDSAELQLQQEHVVRLETRPPNIEGRGAVSIRDLVRNALRMRPDRIVVGEVRAAEALDMIQAMNTGHEGSMTTVHSNSVEDAFTRLMSMLSMAGTQLSERMMLKMLARAVHVVIHVTRDMSGRRLIREVAEVQGFEEGQIKTNPLFIYEQTDSEGAGAWRCSGWSLLMDRFTAAGIPLDQRWLAWEQ